MAKVIPYNPANKALARKLRKDMTYGEILLWKELKNDQLFGFDFDRQRCIDNYIIDFYCKELMLAIEVDGSSHDGEEAFAKDTTRQQALEKLGLQFLRFTEAEVKYDRLNIIRSIEGAIIEIIKKRHDITLPKGFDRKMLDL